MWGRILRFFVERPVDFKAVVFACRECGGHHYGPCATEKKA
jgi:hypothetical protein